MNRLHGIALCVGVCLAIGGCALDSQDDSSDTWLLYERLGPTSGESDRVVIDDGMTPEGDFDSELDRESPWDNIEDGGTRRGEGIDGGFIDGDEVQRPIGDDGDVPQGPQLPGEDLDDTEDYDSEPGADLANCNPGEFVDCSNMDLRRAEWEGVNASKSDLFGVNLSGANLEGADLSYAKLAEASLRHANLRGANLWGADLEDADLTGADLQGANLSYAKVSFAKMRNVDLTRADLTGADLQRSDLSGAVLHKATLKYADFSDSTLSQADLSNCDAMSIRFKRANLQDVDFSHCDLRFADFVDAKMQRALLISAGSQSADYRRANLTNADLTLAKLRFAVNLSEATTDGVVWQSTQCPDGTMAQNNGGSCEEHF